MVVQADALDKGGGEKESRRDGAKEGWVSIKHCIMWCSKKVKRRPRDEKKGCLTRRKLVGGLYRVYDRKMHPLASEWQWLCN